MDDTLSNLQKDLGLIEAPPFQFLFPSNCGLYGMSQSGKSTFLANAIKERKRLFKLENGFEDIHKIFYFYGSVFQPNFEELAREENVTFIQGLPENIASIFQPEDIGKPIILIFDDLMDLIEGNPEMFQLLFKDSHHMNLCVFITFQTLHPKGKLAVSMREQLHFQVIFKMPGEKQNVSRRLGSFVIGERGKGLTRFYTERVMNQGPGGYIVINNHPKLEDSRMKFCCNIFAHEAPLRVLVPK